MKKKILSILIAIICILGAYATYLFYSTPKNNEQNQLPVIFNVDRVETNDQTTEKTTAPENPVTKKTTNQQPVKEEERTVEEVAPEINTVVKEDQFTGMLDMDNWKYNEKVGIYYQTGIYYAKASLDSEYQKMALFVPEKYLQCEKQNNDIYSCVPNMAAIIKGHTVRTAPIVTMIDFPDYKAQVALTEYRNFKEFTDAGLVYAHIGFRGIESGALATVADIKAAVHFIKYNSERIPGHTDSIYILAANEGTIPASVIGASGNDRGYQPYLQQIGALNGVNDNVKGIMLVNPISGLDTANEAVEWFFSANRNNISKEQKNISEKMAKEYAEYINRAGFIGPNKQALTLQYSQNGVYQNGTYYDYVKKSIASSLEIFLTQNNFPYNVPQTWEITEDAATKAGTIKLTGTYQTRKKFFDDLNAKKVWVMDNSLGGVKISSIKDFLDTFRIPQLPIARYDGFNKNNKENILFGLGDKKGVHFDVYTAKTFKNTPQGKDFETDLYKRDKAGNTTTARVDLNNPLYYLVSSYDGYNTSTVAPFWRIRAGLLQTKTILPATINLFLAVKNYPNVKDTDYEIVWGMGDINGIREKDKLEFIKWISKKQQ